MSRNPSTRGGCLSHPRRVRVRRTPEVHPIGGQILLFGTDDDRHGPVHEDDHGACRPAIRLATFCYPPIPVKSGGSHRYQMIESSLSTTMILSERRATADRRHIVHPLRAGPATAPAPYGHTTSE
jgi:hypothetical protein